MSYKNYLKTEAKINPSYKIVDSSKESEIRRNNPYVDVEAYFYDILDENNNYVETYEVEVSTQTSTHKEEKKIKKLDSSR